MFYSFQSVVIPTRRATANAFQMLMTHAFGDATSPFIIGIVGPSIGFYLLLLIAFHVKELRSENGSPVLR